MYNPDLEALIDAALADGELTEKEKQILFKKAQAMGVDLDEFEMVLDARLVKLKKAEQEKAASSAPKSNKLGDVKKCPACGAIVQSYQGVCPECGYAFEGTDANSSVKELSSLLQKESDRDKMEKIIDYFPIPMEKASLLAFVTWLRPQSTDTNNPLANAYYKKYAECVNKIKVSFANDKDLSPFITHLAEDEKKIKKQKIIGFTIKNKWFWVGVVALIALCWLLKPTPTRNSKEKTSVAIEKAIKEGNIQKAVNIFLDYEGKERKGRYKGKLELAKEGTALSVVNACLADGNLSDAIRVGTAAEMEYYGYDDFSHTLASTIYEYCVNHGEFEKAKSIYQAGVCPYFFHGKYIKDAVIYLCENGKIDEAQRFFNNNKADIDETRDKLGSKNEVIKTIQDIINSYK